MQGSLLGVYLAFVEKTIVSLLGSWGLAFCYLAIVAEQICFGAKKPLRIRGTANAVQAGLVGFYLYYDQGNALRGGAYGAYFLDRDAHCSSSFANLPAACALTMYRAAAPAHSI